MAPLSLTATPTGMSTATAHGPLPSPARGGERGLEGSGYDTTPATRAQGTAEALFTAFPDGIQARTPKDNEIGG